MLFVRESIRIVGKTVCWLAPSTQPYILHRPCQKQLHFTPSLSLSLTILCLKIGHWFIPLWYFNDKHGALWYTSCLSECTQVSGWPHLHTNRRAKLSLEKANRKTDAGLFCRLDSTARMLLIITTRGSGLSYSLACRLLTTGRKSWCRWDLSPCCWLRFLGLHQGTCRHIGLSSLSSLSSASASSSCAEFPSR